MYYGDISELSCCVTGESSYS